jgi:YSIRK-targeted surface antigen transcriptional regulator
MLGPIFSTAVTDDTVREFMHELAIAPEHREMIQTFLKNIPVMSYNQIMQTLAYVHYLINDEVIDLTTHFSLNDKNKMTEISSSHPEKMMNARENQIFHNTYHYERLLLEHVQNGDTDKLEALLRQSDNLQRGVMSDNALREEKNIFITLATMVSRAAIQGGMDIEQAYQLSDTYVQECEKTQNINAIANLSYSMVHDFTARVATNKIPGGMSKEVFDCIQFISRNINEPIQVGDVIHYIGKSRSYMTKKFKEELGFDISSFIMRCKLEEAKSLLTYTDKSLSEISTYLCFSTQAYFQNVFKKKYGITPNEYRKRSQQI